MSEGVSTPLSDGESVPAEVVDAVFGADCERAYAYVSLLAQQGIEWGLIGPREAGRLWSRHVFNSASPAELIPNGASVVDVGSGAGLPGIPLALVRPDMRMTLLEPQERRHEFLTLVLDRLDLTDRVEVVRSRSEEYRETFDVVTSRAVAPLPRILRDQWHLRRASGTLLAIKGASASAEVDKSRTELAKRRASADVLRVRAHARTEPTSVVRVRSK